MSEVSLCCIESSSISVQQGNVPGGKRRGGETRVSRPWTLSLRPVDERGSRKIDIDPSLITHCQLGCQGFESRVWVSQFRV